MGSARSSEAALRVFVRLLCAFDRDGASQLVGAMKHRADFVKFDFFEYVCLFGRVEDGVESFVTDRPLLLHAKELHVCEGFFALFAVQVELNLGVKTADTGTFHLLGESRVA